MIMNQFYLENKPYKTGIFIRAISLLFICTCFGLQIANASTTGNSDAGKSILAQSTIKGTVTDSKGVPLAGVNIVEKGTTNGTQTDFDGSFTINVSSNATLVISIVGFKTKEVVVGERNTIKIVLEEKTNQLDEIVVIGYGSRLKKDLTGAISTLGSKELIKEVRMSPELAMQGKMAGVFVSNPGSDPNARPTIRIRGVSTLGFNDPLYVIDGVPITEGFNGGSARESDLRGNVNIMNMINSNDIESISVLKDATSTAIYGVRASNGVILIKTKRGKSGAPKINFTATTGIQNHNKRYDVLNTNDYVAAYDQAWKNNPSEPRGDYGPLYDPNSPEYLGNNGTYDWTDKIVRKNALIQDINLNISGGNDFSNYSLGAGYATQDNVILGSDFERYSFFINSDHKVKKWLKVGESYRVVSTDTDSFNSMSLSDAALTAPWQPIYDSNGLGGYALPGREIDGTFNSRGYGNSTRNNVFGMNNYMKNNNQLLRHLGSTYVEVSPIDGLKLRGTLGIDYYTNKRNLFSTKEWSVFDADRGVVDPNGTSYSIRTTENLNITKEFLIGYNKAFGGHNFDVILNAMQQEYSYDVLQMGGIKLPFDSYGDRNIPEGTNPSFYERNKRSLIGYMGRLSYNYNSKYYIDATVRRDGSAAFNEGNKWGTFPAFGAAYRLSSEEFMKNVTFINDLKIRAGWGQTGNQETKPFNYLALVNQNNPKYALGSTTGDGVLNSGAFVSTFPVTNTTWETVTTSNIGFDALLINSKLSVTAEYYKRETEGILQNIPISQLIGALYNPDVNLASVENSGFELQLGYNDRFGELGVSANFNFTTVKNRVTKMYNDRPLYGGGGYNLEVGQSLGFIRGYQTGGIFQTQAQVTEWLANNSDPGNSVQKAPGDFYFVDNGSAPTAADGNNVFVSPVKDGVINDFDQVYLGKTIAGYYYGLGLNFDYKGIDLGFTFRGVGDVQKINYERMAGEQGAYGGINQFSSIKGAWTAENPSTTMPRNISGDPSSNNRFSNRWVEDGDFFRLQNLQLGYNFNKDFLSKIKANNLRAFISFSNVFVITKYSGLDPEDDSTPKVMTIGLNVGF
jgi:TonB-linked SusC/RagA family outer membrane protein